MMNYRLKQDIVADTVRQWLMDGRYKQGDQLPPDTTLSEQFQMNKHTVAQGLNQLVAEDLLTRASKRGTVVKKTFTPPVTNAVPLISLTEGHFFADIVRFLDQRLQEHELYPILVNRMIAYEKADIMSSLHRIINKNQPYGFLFVGEGHFPYEYIKEKSFRFRNSVFIFHYHWHEELPFCRYVLTDHQAMGRKAVEYFAQRGIKKILFPAVFEKEYTGPHSSIQVQIMKSMKEHAAAAGLEFDESLFWRTHGGAKMEDMLLQIQDCDLQNWGIFAYSDTNIVHRVFPALQQRGIDPDTIPILSNYNTPHAQEYHFDSFDIQAQKTILKAVDMLTGVCNDQKVLIEPEIVTHHRIN